MTPTDIQDVAELLQALADRNCPNHLGGDLRLWVSPDKKLVFPVLPYRAPARRKYVAEEEETSGLGQRELDILQAVAEHFESDGAEAMKADDIAAKSGYDNTGQFRQSLADLCKSGRLKRNPRGPGYLPGNR